MTESNYKIKFTETQKSVNCEVQVEGVTGKDVLDEAKELFKEAQSFSKTKTMEKVM